MREPLDRDLANASWSQMQNNAAIIHLEYNHSDHIPLLLDTDYYSVARADPNMKQPRFEAKWFKEEGFKEIVEDK
jgi:predicted double-glycine peptidase